MIKEITLRQFNAYCYIRAPFIEVFSSEIAWFEAFNKKLVATIILDKIDRDYSYIILGRDERKVFRAITLPKDFYNNIEDAKDFLLLRLREFENDGKEIYEQGDTKQLPQEFLIPKVSNEKLHPYFNLLLTQQGYEAAKNLINEIVYSFFDVDGNYIKDFQSTGFDGRLWELYLYVYLYSTGFTIDNSFNAPDFAVSYWGKECTIEAVTVNRSEKFDEKPPSNSKEAFLLSRDYMPIKFGSSLTSKLQKEYWNKGHVKGKPFILAIHDFHMAATPENLGSMTWSRTALIDYLYGVRMIHHIDEDGKIVFHLKTSDAGVEAELEIIESHTWKGKSIPSNFFNLPSSENVSAVLFSNNATLTTFNRMGKLAGLGNESTIMIRTSSLYNPDPNAAEAIIKISNIDDADYEESWGDGLVMYHNPNALFPLDRANFPDISHMYFDKEKRSLYGFTRPYDVLSSFTMVIITDPKG